MSQLLKFYLVSTLPTTVDDTTVSPGSMYFDKEDKSLHLLTSIDTTSKQPTFLRVQDTISFCENPIIIDNSKNYIQLDNSNFSNSPIAENGHFYISYTLKDSIVISGVKLGNNIYSFTNSATMTLYNGTIGFIYGGINTTNNTVVLHKIAEVKNNEYTNDTIDAKFASKAGAEMTGLLNYNSTISNGINATTSILTIPSIQYLKNYLIYQGTSAPSIESNYILYINTDNNYLYYKKNNTTWVQISMNPTWK